MTKDPDLDMQQLMKDRDNMAHQISNREKEIAHLTKRLKSCKPSATRQVTMLDADRGMLVNLEAALARNAQK